MSDSLGFREAILGLPEQFEAAWRGLSVTGPLPDNEDITNVLVLGTGAAGWVGDLLAAVVGPFMPVPLVVHKGFSPPSFVESGTLVMAISASGNAPETVASATTCVEEGGQLFAITSGGSLGALADATAAPTVFLPQAAAIPVPPRARIGALAVPVLAAFESIGLFPGGRDWIAAAIAQLRARRDELAEPDNLAVSLARSIAGTMPLVYGGAALGGVAAARWKDQINQCAKSPAWTGELPDVTHGELAGWGQHGDITRQVFSLVLLRHDEEPPEVSEQFRLVEEWSEEVMAGIHTVQAAGEGALAQLLDLALIGDVVAIELADRYGIDPGPTPVLAQSPVVPDGEPGSLAATTSGTDA
ncbi:MAG: SIS domain-containing protein [Aquihabitans sp.]